MKVLSILVKFPGEDPEVRSIETSSDVYNYIREQIGGYIELISLAANNLFLLADVDNRVKSSRYNIQLKDPTRLISGPVVLVRIERGRIVSLKESDVEWGSEFLKKHSARFHPPVKMNLQEDRV